MTDQMKANVRQLRAEMTNAERRLWYHLRRHGMSGYKFRRQHPFGPYILDFYCPDTRLVVEVDGGQHYEDENMRRDAVRTRYLESHGLRVLRFSNIETLKETEAVLNVILEALGNPSP